MAKFLRGHHLATWWQVDYIGSFPWWRDLQFPVIKIDTYFEYRFSFSACNASAGTIIHLHSIPKHRVIKKKKKNSFYSKEYMVVLCVFDRWRSN